MKITSLGIQVGERHIGWERIRQVAIRTTADGPFSEDLFWVFDTTDGVIELPGARVGGEELGALQGNLPHFDDLKVIRAMSTTEERIFVLWDTERSREQPATSDRFSGLVTRLGGTASPEIFEKLRAAWSAEARHYHDLEHLADCLYELDTTGANDIVELALWYHDAIYVAGAPDNEERSARLLLEDARTLHIPSTTAEAAATCIRATAHLDGSPPTTPAAELTVDIDLAILGRSPLRFMDFEYAVAEEYAAVPAPLFFRARRKLLESLLARPAIYRTPALRSRYESTARSNITRLLASPRYRKSSLLGVLSRLWGGR